jgi:hypothetical protein
VLSSWYTKTIKKKREAKRMDLMLATSLLILLLLLSRRQKHRHGKRTDFGREETVWRTTP